MTETFAYALDGTPLTWEVYAPAGAGPFPAVLATHGGGFKKEEEAPKKLAVTINDCVAAGYIVFANHYRLAPPGLIAGQVGNGRYPQQHDDEAMAVLTARNDIRTTSKVGIVGGSAGATHALWACANGIIGQDRADCGVCLSGAYDYTDRTFDLNINAFAQSCANYCGCLTTDMVTLGADSPINHLAADMSPTFLVNSDQDTMPPHQMDDIVAALTTVGVTNTSSRTITGFPHLHAFAIWPYVSSDAIAFLDANLK